MAEGGEPIDSDGMDHREMIEFLTFFCRSARAPNGMLNDASDWEYKKLPLLVCTPLADSTNTAAPSSISAAAAAPLYTWSLDKATAA